MFEVVEIKRYDTYHSYGTDWHTDFIIKTDEEYDIKQIFNKLKDLGYSPYGQLSLEKTDDGYIYKTVMY
ncbi:MAG: hypothetical protein ACI4S3_07310 [Candidatus Gastranaerophilaceae bacterium]